MPVKKKLLICSILAVMIALIAIILIGKMRANKQNEKINGYLKEAMQNRSEKQPVDMTTQDFKRLINIIQGGLKEEALGNYYLTLQLAHLTDGKAGDYEKIIFNEINERGTLSLTRKRLLDATFQHRKSEFIVTPALKLAAESDDEKVSAAAVNATFKSIEPTDIGELIALMSNPHKLTRSKAERTIVKLFGRGADLPYMTHEITKAYKSSSNDDVRRAFLRTLGASGAAEARKPIISALNSETAADRFAAYAALQNCSDYELFPPLLEKITDNTDPLERQSAFAAAISILGKNRALEASLKESMWKKLHAAGTRSKEKLKLINIFANFDDEWSMALLSAFAKDNDDSIVERAELAINHRNTPKED